MMQTRGPGRFLRRTRRFVLVAAVIVVVGIVSAAAAVTYSYDIRWRAAVLYYKASGQLHDIGWPDLITMLRPGSGIYLEPLATTLNPFAVIQSPLRSAADRDAGEQLFRDQCTLCHGPQGRGATGGPNLHDHVFRQGRSDWALYRTIAHGIPGTPMVGRDLSREDIWRLVSYLDQILANADRGPAGEAGAAPVADLVPVTAEDLRGTDDDPGEWLTYSGSYQSHRYSRLAQIDRTNVRRLAIAWVHQFATTETRSETSPIVRGSTMFVSESPDGVHAIDAATGRTLWTYRRVLPERLLLCCGAVNRGVAILGTRVFVGTLDAHLVALDAATGKVLWDVAVGEPLSAYSITGAPLAVDDMIVTGVAGGEFAVHGFIDAYDAATGKRRWRFNTVPEPGEPGSETWGGAPPHSSGAPTWLTGSFDPELDLIYWGVGNPSPEFLGEDRPGDNLYSDSVVAIDAASGKLRWYFQFTPHDLHDWDSTQIPVLLDGEFGQSKRKLIAWANRNAFYYLLDRATGEFLLGTPFVRETWADGLDARGRPQVRPESAPSRAGAVVYPSVAGGTNWWSPSYDPQSGLLYVPTIDRGSVFYAGRGAGADSGGQILGGTSTWVPDEEMIVAVKALEPTTGRVRWQHLEPPRQLHGELGGLMSTAGGLVFGGDNDVFFALDADTGAELWHFDVGAQIRAAPVTYQLGGRQYVTIAASRSILTFALPTSE
jgi:alcohol dehydrogenase (cytochrome c)